MRTLILLLLMCSSNAFAGFSAAYRQPQSAADGASANLLRQSHALDRVVAELNRSIAVPGDIPVIAQSCGTANAYYSPDRREVTICYELITQHAAKLHQAYKQAPGTGDGILTAEIIYALLHEVGHAVFDVHKIPVLGKEEDAADEFAAFLLLSTGGATVLQQAPFFMPLTKTPWLKKTLYGAAVYGDEHALSEQRMANLICYGYGKDPQGFANAATAIRLPQHRADRCATEYAKMDRNIRGLLGDKLTLNGHHARMDVAEQQQPVRQSSMVPTLDDLTVQMLEHYSCGSCHNLDLRHVGPAFKEVASRYRGRDVVAQLAQNVRTGSSGIWGPVAAPQLSSIPETDAKEMVRWILNL